MRIVSLLASGTELVCALGAGEQLVGRSHECDHPQWVTALPVLSRPTFDVTGPSGEIDRRVREKLRAGQPLYQVDEAALAALRPDVVITQTHCEVCAVSRPSDPPGTPLRRERAVALRTGTLAGVLAGFQEIADLIGRRDEGLRLVAAAHSRIERWRAATAALPRPGLVCLEWTDPPFPMGNWGPELVALAGGQDLLAGPAGAHSRAVSWDAVLAADPEVLVVAPCGFTLERAAGELPQLAARPGWRDLRAVRTGRVHVADGNLYFNRSGPSLFESIDILAEILHPGVFPVRFEGAAWRRA